MPDQIGGKIVWDLEVDDTKLRQGLDEAKRKLKDAADDGDVQAKKLEGSFTKTGKKIADSMDSVGKSMIILGAAPTLALIGVTKAAIDFESSFAGIRKTVDLSEAGFAQLSTNLRNISKEAPVSVNELNRITELAGQLGISGVGNLTKFTETISKFTTATGVAGETAASSFARIANVMQEPIENIDRMGSVVAQLGDSSAATEGEILDFSERIAGAGKIAGLSTANIFSIGAAMASVGIEAEAGGTAVQKVLISMYQAASGSTAAVIDNSKAIGDNTGKLAELKGKLSIAQQQQKEFGDKTKESSKMLKDQQIQKYTGDIAAMESKLGALNATNGQAAISGTAFAKVLGVTNKQFEEMFKKDPEKVFQMFVEKLGDISEKGGDAAGVLEDLELGDQRLIRSFLSLSNAGDLLAKQIQVGNKEWEDNNRLNEEAEKRYKTTASQIQIAKNRFNDIGITIGSAVLPALNDLLLKLKPIIEGFANWAAANPELLSKILIIGAAVGLLGGALVILGSVVGAIVTIAPVVGAAFTLMFGPLGLIIIAVAALAGGIIYLKTQTDILKTSQDLLKTSNENLKKSQDDLKNAENELVDAHLRIQGTTLAVERAQLNYNDAVKRYGPTSLEAREASLQLEQAKRNDEKATKDGEKALKDYEDKQKINIETEKTHKENIEKTESAWWKLKDSILGALKALVDWNNNLNEKSFGLLGFRGLNVDKNADGTRNYKGGLSVVGEEGPELVNLPRGADVFSNGESRDILGGMNNNARSVDRSVKIDIENVHVREQSDIDDLARQIGFKVEQSSGYVQ